MGAIGAVISFDAVGVVVSLLAGVWVERSFEGESAESLSLSTYSALLYRLLTCLLLTSPLRFLTWEVGCVSDSCSLSLEG